MWIFIVYLPNCNLFLVAKTVWGGFFLYNICHTLLSHFEFSKWVKFIFSPWRRRAEAQRLWRLFCVHLSSCVLSKTQDSNPDITCSRVNTKVLRNILTFLSIVQIFLFSWKKKKKNLKWVKDQVFCLFPVHISLKRDSFYPQFQILLCPLYTHTCGTCGSLFSPCTVSVLAIELRLSVLVASAFTISWTISLTLACLCRSIVVPFS